MDLLKAGLNNTYASRTTRFQHHGYLFELQETPQISKSMISMVLFTGLGKAVICKQYLQRKNGGNLVIRSGMSQSIDS